MPDEFQPIPISAPADIADLIALGSIHADPIPDETTEAFARSMREQYLALRGQNFTENQALHIIGSVFAAVLTANMGNADEDDS